MAHWDILGVDLLGLEEIRSDKDGTGTGGDYTYILLGMLIITKGHALLQIRESYHQLRVECFVNDRMSFGL